jgi:hypothetical protein
VSLLSRGLNRIHPKRLRDFEAGKKPAMEAAHRVSPLIDKAIEKLDKRVSQTIPKPAAMKKTSSGTLSGGLRLSMLGF